MADGGKLVLGIELDTKSFDKQIEKTEKRLIELNQAYEHEKSKDPFKVDKKLLREYEVEIEKTTNKLIQLQQQQQKISLSKVKNIEFNPLKSDQSYKFQLQQYEGVKMKDFNSEQLDYIATDFQDFKKGIDESNDGLQEMEENLDDVGEKSSNAANKGSSKFQKLGSVIRRVGLRILGISTIYGIVSKASSAYLSQDTELAQKLQSVWVGLGSFLAPVLEMMAEVMAKAVGYLNVFITALTGTDYIAKANAKALNKQTQAQIGLNKAVERYSYDFDVIRKQNEQNDSGGGISGGGIDTSGFEMPELNQKIVEKLQNLAKWLKENKKLIEDVGKVLGITFGALAIASLLKNIASLIGVGGAGGSGLAALAWLLGIIAAVWLGKIIIEGLAEAIEQAKELNEQLDDNIIKMQGTADKTKELAKGYYELAMEEEGSGAATKKATDYFYKQAKALDDHIVRLQGDKNLIGAVTGANEKLRKEQSALLDGLIELTNKFYGLYQEGKLNEEQMKEFEKVLDSTRNMMTLLGRDTKEVDKIIDQISREKHMIRVEAQLQDNVSNQLQSIIDRFNWKTIGLKAITDTAYQGYAAGGIVTQPTRALIGEAGYPEAVVPMTKDYLSTLAEAISQYGGAGGSGTVNVYLDGRLIQKQVDNRQKQANFARNM